MSELPRTEPVSLEEWVDFKQESFRKLDAIQTEIAASEAAK